MQPVNLFDIASKQAQWLSVRQAAIAGNIANANTPGYTAGDVEPFEKVLDRGPLSVSATQAGHVGAIEAASFEIRHQDSTASVLPSGNSVVLEDELVKAGEVRRSYELNTAIVRSFHSMIMLASRG
jgi:flagellar basal-body rod protein FlgB